MTYTADPSDVNKPLDGDYAQVAARELRALKAKVNGLEIVANAGLSPAVISVKNFGAKGDGITDDSAAIRSAFLASKNIHFPPGTYYLGTYTSGQVAIDLSALGEGITMSTGGSVKFTIGISGSGIVYAFKLKANSHFYCDCARFEGIGYDASVTWKGAVGFLLDCDVGSGGWGNVHIESIYSRYMVASMQVAGGGAADRIRGIHIGQIFSDDCYYGYNSSNQGDSVTIGKIYAYQNYRAFFAYGCTDNTVDVIVRNNRASTGAVVIASYSPFKTSGMRIKYAARDSSAVFTHILFEQFGPNLNNAAITDCDLYLDINEAVTNVPVEIINVDVSGGTILTTAQQSTFDNIYIRGKTNTGTLMQCSARFTTPGRVSVTGKLREQLSAGFLAALKLSSSIAYTPTWAVASGAAPAIGNGSLSAEYWVEGEFCVVNLLMQAGSTTTFGGGSWTFSLPIPAKNAGLLVAGMVRILDASAAFLLAAAEIQAGDNKFQITAHNTAAQVGPTVPMTWTTTDALFATLRYPI